MAIISDNTKGNKYHSEKTGQFVSGGQSDVSNSEDVGLNASDNDWSLDDLVSKDSSDDWDLDLLFNNNNDDDWDLDNLEYIDDGEKEAIQGISETLEYFSDNHYLQDVAEASKDDIFNALLNNPDLDKFKIQSLSDEERLKLLQAITLLENKDKNDGKIKGDKTFYNIWKNPVSVSQYQYYKDSIPLKKDYFEYTYLGSDKAEKLAQVDEFEKLGKEYVQKQQPIQDRYNKLSDFVSKFYDTDSAYTQERKDNAIWVLNDNISQSKKFFGPKAQEVYDYFQNYNPKAFNYLQSYTGSYSSINNPLRLKQYQFSSENTEKAAQFQSAVKGMTEVIDKSTYDKDIWLQRAVSNLSDKNIGLEIDESTDIAYLQSLVGKTFKDQGFLSCGAAKGSGFNNSIILNIYCPKGTKMFYIQPWSYYSNENEMIIQRGYSYKIRKAEKKGYKIYLDVDCILGSDKDKYNDEQLKEISQKYF